MLKKKTKHAINSFCKSCSVPLTSAKEYIPVSLNGSLVSDSSSTVSWCWRISIHISNKPDGPADSYSWHESKILPWFCNATEDAEFNSQLLADYRCNFPDAEWWEIVSTDIESRSSSWFHSESFNSYSFSVRQLATFPKWNFGSFDTSGQDAEYYQHWKIRDVCEQRKNCKFKRMCEFSDEMPRNQLCNYIQQQSPQPRVHSFSEDAWLRKIFSIY